jgi:hypothetical protein
MRFDLTDGINALEYEVMRNDNAGARVLEAFKQAYKQNPTANPQILFDNAVRAENVNLAFLSSCELSQLQREIDKFLSSC